MKKVLFTVVAVLLFAPTALASAGGQCVRSRVGYRTGHARMRARRARVTIATCEDVELGEGIELIVRVEKEEELEEALERFDPELFVLAAAPDGDDRLEHVLDLLSDLPAGKLAIADVWHVTQPDIDELERAGVDAVLVRELP